MTAVPRIAAGALFCLFVLGLPAAHGATRGDNAYTPTRDAAVLAHVPTTTDPRVRAFEQLAREHEDHPRERTRALALSRAYIDYERHTGDARFLGRAMAPIQPWLASASPPSDVQLVYATILQSRHQFAQARTTLKTLLKTDPDNAQAWLTLATVDMVQGRFARARQDCVHAANTGGQSLALVCNGDLLTLTGQADKAYRLLELLNSESTALPADTGAYIQGLLADAALRQNKRDLAESHFKRGLALSPGDNFLLADYGDFLLDEHRYADVIDRLAPYSDSDTSFLRLVQARVAQDAPNAAASVAAMRQRFAAMDARGSHLYRREQASFVLHVLNAPERALALAKDNWQVQRAPQDARIFLEAALAAGTPHIAAPVIAFLDRSGLNDPIIDALARQATAAPAGANP